MRLDTSTHRSDSHHPKGYRTRCGPICQARIFRSAEYFWPLNRLARLDTGGVWPYSGGMSRIERERAGPTTAGEQQIELEARIGRVGRGLQRSLSELLAAVPGVPKRPVQLSKALGVNQDLAGKALLAASTADPLAATHLMPGPEALRMLAKAARRKRVDSRLVGGVEEAVQQFDDLLRGVVGGRSELDAIISAWLPGTREKFELSNKRAMFRGVSNLKGVVADFGVQAGILAPSGKGDDCCSVIVLSGLVGLRRLRPGSTICLSSGAVGPGAQEVSRFTLDGQPVDLRRGETLLEQFSTSPLPAFDIRENDGYVQHLLRDGLVGLEARVDVFLGELMTGIRNRYQLPGSNRRIGGSADVELPLKILVFDMLIHDAVWPDQTPELLLFDTILRGHADANDPARQSDRLDLRETIEPLDHGIRGCRIAEVPRYTELLCYACDCVGWQPEAFRCYRCRIQYPFYGMQVHMTFDAPSPPADATARSSGAEDAS